MPYDIDDIYPFFCARYRDMTYNELMKMGYEEFMMKLNSVPENEPLYKKIKSRSIEVNKIKDKEERKYWQELQRINRIPDIYLPTEELNKDIMNKVKERGINNVR